MNKNLTNRGQGNIKADKNLEGRKIGSSEGKLVNESSLSENLQVQQSDKNLSTKNNLPSYLPTFLSSKKAFTLAEILITLGIIGVVSAITLPTLIKIYQKHVTVNRLKSTYSILQQAIKLSEAYNGNIENWDILDEGASLNTRYNNGKTFFDIYLKPYIKTVKIYSKEEVQANKIINYSLAYQWLFTFALANGVSIAMVTRTNRVEFNIDINGTKPPNKMGKDVFVLVLFKTPINSSLYGYYGYITKPGLYFPGHGFDRNYLLQNDVHCDCSGKEGGGCKKTFCGALIQTDGWKIEKDYPW